MNIQLDENCARCALLNNGCPINGGAGASHCALWKCNKCGAERTPFEGQPKAIPARCEC